MMHWYQQLQTFLNLVQNPIKRRLWSIPFNCLRFLHAYMYMSENAQSRAVLCANALLTSDFSVKGHAHTTHSIVGCSCNLASASSSMSAETQEEKVADSKGNK